MGLNFPEGALCGFAGPRGVDCHDPRRATIPERGGRDPRRQQGLHFQQKLKYCLKTAIPSFTASAPMHRLASHGRQLLVFSATVSAELGISRKRQSGFQNPAADYGRIFSKKRLVSMLQAGIAVYGPNGPRGRNPIRS